MPRGPGETKVYSFPLYCVTTMLPPAGLVASAVQLKSKARFISQGSQHLKSLSTFSTSPHVMADVSRYTKQTGTQIAVSTSFLHSVNNQNANIF